MPLSFSFRNFLFDPFFKYFFQKHELGCFQTSTKSQTKLQVVSTVNNLFQTQAINLNVHATPHLHSVTAHIFYPGFSFFPIDHFFPLSNVFFFPKQQFKCIIFFLQFFCNLFRLLTPQCCPAPLFQKTRNSNRLNHFSTPPKMIEDKLAKKKRAFFSLYSPHEASASSIFIFIIPLSVIIVHYSPLSFLFFEPCSILRIFIIHFSNVVNCSLVILISPCFLKFPLFLFFQKS